MKATLKKSAVFPFGSSFLLGCQEVWICLFLQLTLVSLKFSSHRAHLSPLPWQVARHWGVPEAWPCCVGIVLASSLPIGLVLHFLDWLRLPPEHSLETFRFLVLITQNLQGLIDPALGTSTLWPPAGAPWSTWVRRSSLVLWKPLWPEGPHCGWNSPK